MDVYKQLAIRALKRMKGDDLERARFAFKGFTPQQMQQQHGFSGKTRAEILAQYEEADAGIDAAIRWVNNR